MQISLDCHTDYFFEMPLMRDELITLKFNHLTHLRWTKIRDKKEGIICNKHELCKKRVFLSEGLSHASTAT